MSSSTKEIKRRIRSAKNIQQITKAMETVSATKMRRAQDRALSGRVYAEKAFLMLQNLAKNTKVEEHPLLVTKQTGRQLVVVITPDKGLVGSLNTNLFRKLQDFLHEQEELKRETDFIAIGRRGENFLQKNNKKILLSKTGLGDMFVPDEIAEIVETMIHGYTKGPYDKVIMCYTNFFSTLSQKPFIRGILPLTYDKIEDVGDLRTEMAEKLANNDESPEVDYIFEPSKKSVLEELLPRLLDAIIYHNVLEATASEHSARMVAMKSASDNAKDLIDEFTLSYNRLRQEGITKELAEISAASSTI